MPAPSTTHSTPEAIGPSTLPKLSEASKKKLERLIATLNAWPESELDGYLEDHPEKAKAVVQTLKHIANPLADYPTDADFLKEYNDIIIAFDDPRKLAPNMHYLSLTNDEEIYLKELMKIKFDQLANQTMIKFNIDRNSLTEAPASQTNNPAREPIKPLSREDQWWESRTAEQKREIQERCNNLNDTQRTHLNQRMDYIYHQRSYDDHLRYYQMAMIDTELRYLSVRMTLDLTDLTVRLIAASAKAAFQYGMNHASSLSNITNVLGGRKKSSDKSDKSDDAKAILATAAFIVFGSTAIIGCVYGIKKLYNSSRNLLLWRKPLKSLARILGIMGGGVAGTFIGAQIGVELAVAIPSMAIATGVTLGIIFGAALCAGVGALVTKYLCKAIYAYYNPDELSPTNPDKWRLSTAQIHNLTSQGINVDRVNQEIRAIKQEKDNIGIEGSMFWTSARQRKNELNDNLTRIKQEHSFAREYPPRYDFFTPYSARESRYNSPSTSFYRMAY